MYTLISDPDLGSTQAMKEFNSSLNKQTSEYWLFSSLPDQSTSLPLYSSSVQPEILVFSRLAIIILFPPRKIKLPWALPYTPRSWLISILTFISYPVPFQKLQNYIYMCPYAYQHTVNTPTCIMPYFFPHRCPINTSNSYLRKKSLSSSEPYPFLGFLCWRMVAPPIQAQKSKIQIFLDSDPSLPIPN